MNEGGSSQVGVEIDLTTSKLKCGQEGIAEELWFCFCCQYTWSYCCNDNFLCCDLSNYYLLAHFRGRTEIFFPSNVYISGT